MVPVVPTRTWIKNRYMTIITQPRAIAWCIHTSLFGWFLVIHPTFNRWDIFFAKEPYHKGYEYAMVLNLGPLHLTVSVTS